MFNLNPHFGDIAISKYIYMLKKEIDQENDHYTQLKSPS